MENNKIVELNVRSTLVELEMLMNVYAKMNKGVIPADNAMKENVSALIKFYSGFITDWVDSVQSLSLKD